MSYASRVAPEDRKKASGRSGTRLDPDFKLAIYAPSLRGSKSQHGTLDTRQRVYQGGGEVRNFTYQRKGWITIAADAWKQVQGRCDWVEMIDHKKNVAYVIDAQTFDENKNWYDAGIGPRYGVDASLWEKVKGVILRNEDDDD